MLTGRAASEPRRGRSPVRGISHAAAAAEGDRDETLGAARSKAAAQQRLLTEQLSSQCASLAAWQARLQAAYEDQCCTLERVVRQAEKQHRQVANIEFFLAEEFEAFRSLPELEEPDSLATSPIWQRLGGPAPGDVEERLEVVVGMLHGEREARCSEAAHVEAALHANFQVLSEGLEKRLQEALEDLAHHAAPVPAERPEEEKEPRGHPDASLVDAALARERAVQAARGDLPSQLRLELTAQLEAVDTELRAEITDRANAIEAMLLDEFNTRITTFDTELKCDMAARFKTLKAEVQEMRSLAVPSAQVKGLENEMKVMRQELAASVDAIRVTLELRADQRVGGPPASWNHPQPQELFRPPMADEVQGPRRGMPQEPQPPRTPVSQQPPPPAAQEKATDKAAEMDMHAVRHAFEELVLNDAQFQEPSEARPGLKHDLSASAKAVLGPRHEERPERALRAPAELREASQASDRLDASVRRDAGRERVTRQASAPEPPPKAMVLQREFPVMPAQVQTLSFVAQAVPQLEGIGPGVAIPSPVHARPTAQIVTEPPKVQVSGGHSVAARERQAPTQGMPLSVRGASPQPHSGQVYELGTDAKGVRHVTPGRLVPALWAKSQSLLQDSPFVPLSASPHTKGRDWKSPRRSARQVATPQPGSQRHSSLGPRPLTSGTPAPQPPMTPLIKQQWDREPTENVLRQPPPPAQQPQQPPPQSQTPSRPAGAGAGSAAATAAATALFRDGAGGMAAQHAAARSPQRSSRAGPPAGHAGFPLPAAAMARAAAMPSAGPSAGLLASPRASASMLPQRGMQGAASPQPGYRHSGAVLGAQRSASMLAHL